MSAHRSGRLVKKVDVAVIGGGPAGVAAALAAREQGRKVALIERYGFMGGMATAGMIGSMCGFYGKIDGAPTMLVGGIAARFCERMRETGGLGPLIEIYGQTYVVPYDIQAFKFVCDDMIAESGVELILHALAMETVTEDGSLREVVLATKGGKLRLQAEFFVDTTGDGDVAAAAGAPYDLNAERLQFPSTLFTVANADLKQAAQITPEKWVELVEMARERGFRLPRLTGSLRNLPGNGLFRLNVTLISRDGKALNGVDAEDLTFAELEGRRQVREYFRFLKELVPGFADSYIAEIAPQVGIRETRKIAGEYVLQEEDIRMNALPSDTIALNGWPLEIHGESNRTLWEFIPGKGYHGIPFRCLQPLGLKNVLVAGRCLSATSRALSAVRVMGPAMATGEAAGTAAALAVGGGLDDSRNLPIERLLRTLEERGAILSL
jgi:hypothetical protein